jgi:hypothetical protein
LRTRFRLRTWILTIAGLALVLAYAGSYYRLSRRGLREAPGYGLDGFLYVPIGEVATTHDLSRHDWLAASYSPANWVDRQLCGGTHPVGCVMWRLSG